MSVNSLNREPDIQIHRSAVHLYFLIVNENIKNTQNNEHNIEFESECKHISMGQSQTSEIL